MFIDMVVLPGVLLLSAYCYNFSLNVCLSFHWYCYNQDFRSIATIFHFHPQPFVQCYLALLLCYIHSLTLQFPVRISWCPSFLPLCIIFMSFNFDTKSNCCLWSYLADPPFFNFRLKIWARLVSSSHFQMAKAELWISLPHSVLLIILFPNHCG